MLLFIIFSADPNEAHVATVTVSWRVQNLLWSVPRIFNRSPPNFGRISNSIEIPSVGQAGIDDYRWFEAIWPISGLVDIYGLPNVHMIEIKQILFSLDLKTKSLIIFQNN